MRHYTLPIFFAKLLTLLLCSGKRLKTITIATRKSALALWQAHYVQRHLENFHSELTVELLPMTTQGDIILDTPLAKIGGKGLFVKELESAILDGRADIAVHSMKDVPMLLPEGLHISAICERADPRDAFISNLYPSLQSLPKGAILGTSSLRRECQIKALRPDLQIKSLRGNVNTRLQKLDDGHYQAIILASAGLQRLQFEDRISEHLSIEQCLPAVGQGAVGIECRVNDHETNQLLQCLHHPDSNDPVMAERAMNKRLQGGCQVPIAGYAVLSDQLPNQQIHLQALVSDVEGNHIIRTEQRGHRQNHEQIGIAAAEHLLAQGAGDILARFGINL